MKRHLLGALALTASLLSYSELPAQQTLDLSGDWQFAIDRTAEGQRPRRYTDHLSLPGSMLTNGKGDEVTVETQWVSSLYDSSYFFNPKMAPYRVPGQMKFPFFLTPERHYVGNAWYRRTVFVPKEWQGQPVTLFLERPHIETFLSVNGKEVGQQSSLSVPHQFDVTPYLRFGKENVIELRIYNGIDRVCVGQDSHSVTDQTQGDWNGIVGRMELRTAPIVWRKRVTPHLANGTATVYINDTVYEVDVRKDCRLSKGAGNGTDGTASYDGKSACEASAWDEFHPTLYSVTLDYHGLSVPVTFGMREVSTRGRDILLNGKVIKLRGTVGNCCFPETGYPPTDVASWERIFLKCKEYGLNAMRFHSYCPPEAAFEAADRVGFYLQPEGPSWPNHGVKLGNGMTIDQYLLEECKAIIDQYGSHPSLVMLAAGNEPAGNWVKWCNQFVQEMHQYDPSRIYADASVGGGWAWADQAEYHVKGGARGLDEWKRQMPQSMDDFSAGMDLPRNFRPTPEHPVNTAPLVSHETGQWCAFPDLKETSQYTGAYKARNFEIFADLLRDNGMEGQAERFLMASGRLQTLAYKFDIERNLRTPDYAGFLLLGLNDYSGQGTALVGPLNVHWMEKGYCTAADWTEFCSEVVPLARFPRFVFGTADTIRVGTMLYNATSGLQQYQCLGYTITQADGRALQVGSVTVGDDITLLPYSLATSQPQNLTTSRPQKLTLTLSVGSHHNHWDFWVYPELPADSPVRSLSAEGTADGQVLLAETLDQRVLDALRAGGSVLLCAGKKIRYGNDVRHQYLPVFWNTSWFKMRPPHTTGSYIQNSHPLFADFPTDDWQNLNWWELVNNCPVMNLAGFPADYQPIVQPIDTWHISRKLGMLVEANVLGGRLILTTMDLTSDPEHRLVARQLLHSVLRYMQSEEFRPQLTLDVATLRALFDQEAPRVDMFTKANPDELKPKIGF